ncbi:UNVERIFIED_CONTAM: Retrovirus-related Pol polyprotein from transposon TNT 1-94 [Sesamum latifolium]|uniref:Retrovirus-related Pol polyprotein from transposon TNT 1-94 n=1 Tax=Sesamum latifolium TaxID=2727402 RepID=A0AAW2XL58_9LAMI
MSDIDSDKWLETMKSKMDSMGSNQVWTLVDPPKGVRPVGCKWVYKRKLGDNGEVTAFKARLVAKAWYDYEIWQMDVKTAFLNSFVEEEIFMDQPKGFTTIEEEQKISGSSVAYLVLYVDDILLIGNDVKMLGDIKAWLSTQFSMKDMGPEEVQDGTLETRSPSHEAWIKLSKKQSPKTDEELKRISDIPYASAVGSIQYAIQCTRPDVAYALSITSRYQTCAGEAHWSAVKSILKYLRRTKDMFLIYGGGELILEGYSDASFQSDDDDAKSQSDFVFKLNGGVVAWKSSKQDTTADSTMKAEYIAASEAA